MCSESCTGNAPYHRDIERGTAISAPEVQRSLGTWNQSHSFVHPATREERNRRDNKDEGKEDQRNNVGGKDEEIEEEEHVGRDVHVGQVSAERSEKYSCPSMFRRKA